MTKKSEYNKTYEVRIRWKSNEELIIIIKIRMKKEVDRKRYLNKMFLA